MKLPKNINTSQLPSKNYQNSAFSSPKTPKNEKSTPGKAPTKIILRSFHDKSRSPNESDNSASNFRMIFGFGVTKKSSKK